MDITTHLISVYCLIDDWLPGKRIRQTDLLWPARPRSLGSGRIRESAGMPLRCRSAYGETGRRSGDEGKGARKD